MTEKEKMIAGMGYFPSDPVLKKERELAKALCFKLNNLAPDQNEEKMELFKTLLGKVEEANIEPSFYCDYGYNIHLGKNFYSNHNLVILDVCPVIIGDNVMFGPNVTVTSAGHPIDAETRNSGLEFGKKITIGNNVWLGANVTVNPGVTIGDNVVIGSGSVVTKDIPANTVAAGVPCKVIREIDQSQAA
ncbi:hypothetical protein GZ77_21720 [Endozoicomonas montiporae]|uniref:Acetyltransferase n=2 Tax=Endozoicomonas montiporae TaxID=1027273 RepID=A0A081N3L2_9GAMM|nr:sugar O-acetyltransferase [Endozoicomonas montiporae]AMO58344.1 maltose O-acetyltransferase [Endozoicomonas montiporae CL-33]KEQ13035.1 hypothetical protein GZ77_21720 [Endozoicomonas montiporae]